MRTQAHFDNIQQHILDEIENSNSSIQIAVAWFTDEKLFSSLCSKAKSGIAVELMLMNDDINNSSGINYNSLSNAGGKIWMISNANGNQSLMHNKFCIIDNNTIINGSYNWTNKARQNHESITIISDNTELALQFSDEFRAIKEQYFGKDAEGIIVDFGIICSRLSAIKEAIRTGDTEDIGYLTGKFKKHIKLFNDRTLSKLYEIIEYIETCRYSDAVKEISEFITRFQSLAVYIDTEIAAFRLELRALELQISSLEDEKIELEKLLHEFEVWHNKELGEIILKILKLRKEKFQKAAKEDPSKEEDFKEAESDYKNFQSNFKDLKHEDVDPLTPEQQKELKKLYRIASKLCHPDAVADIFKAKAESIFKELNEAYNSNNIGKVKSILTDLEKGIFKQGSETENEKQELLRKIVHLRTLRTTLEKEVFSIKRSETYKVVVSISDWDSYFIQTKEELIVELVKLEKELSNGEK